MGNTLLKSWPRVKDHKKKEEEEKEVVSTFTCKICMELMPGNKKFKHIRRSCSNSFCLDCISKYIEVQVEEENTTEIKCPGPGCEEYLEPLSCRPVMPARVFDKWNELLCRSAVLEWPRAYCPFPGCSVLVLNECNERVRRSKCPNCKRDFCFHCKTPWHAGFRCDNTSNTRDRNDILFGQLIETNRWTRCPVCHNSVELVEGCRIIKCRCGACFCYNCGEKTFYSYLHICRIQPCSDWLFLTLLLICFLLAYIVVCLSLQHY